jgi:hypothetical protein
MSTRAYATDLNDSAWAWIAPTCRKRDPADGHARPTCARWSTRSFTCLAPGASGACCLASSRARTPSTTISEHGKMGASWPNGNGHFMRRRASKATGGFASVSLHKSAGPEPGARLSQARRRRGNFRFGAIDPRGGGNRRREATAENGQTRLELGLLLIVYRGVYGTMRPRVFGLTRLRIVRSGSRAARPSV